MICLKYRTGILFNNFLQASLVGNVLWIIVECFLSFDSYSWIISKFFYLLMTFFLIIYYYYLKMVHQWNMQICVKFMGFVEWLELRQENMSWNRYPDNRVFGVTWAEPCLVQPGIVGSWIITMKMKWWICRKRIQRQVFVRYQEDWEFWKFMY